MSDTPTLTDHKGDWYVIGFDYTSKRYEVADPLFSNVDRDWARDQSQLANQHVNTAVIAYSAMHADDLKMWSDRYVLQAEIERKAKLASEENTGV